MELYGYEIHREKDLSHHGILGMKWGVRRYQNPDGTLTRAGKKRRKLANKVSDVANRNAKRLSEEADKIEDTNKKMHSNYDGPDGWKQYALDAYGTADHNEYGISSKEFKDWMSSELKSNLQSSDVWDKQTIREYRNAAKKWADVASAWQKVNVEDISKKEMLAAKTVIIGYSLDDVPLRDLVEHVKD